MALVLAHYDEDVGGNRLFGFCDNRCILTDAHWHAQTGNFLFEKDVTGVQLYNLQLEAVSHY